MQTRRKERKEPFPIISPLISIYIYSSEKEFSASPSILPFFRWPAEGKININLRNTAALNGFTENMLVTLVIFFIPKNDLLEWRRNNNHLFQWLVAVVNHFSGFRRIALSAKFLH